MKLFVGLGNPGAKYAGNRHNIGFMALDRVAVDHGFSPWRRAFQGLVAEGRLGAEKLVLLKPETFMNLSGQSVRAAVDFYKLDLAQITVFHDELDLLPGRVRVKLGGGMRATMDCGRSMAIWATAMRGCVWALVIPATKTPCRAMFCTIFPRQIKTGLTI